MAAFDSDAFSTDAFSSDAFDFGAGGGASGSADASDRHVRQSGVLMHVLRTMRLIVFLLPGVF